MLRRASSVERPMFCSCNVSRSSSPSGPARRSAAIRSEAEKARPASTVTTRRSISSGSDIRSRLRRERARRFTYDTGPIQPNRAESDDAGEREQRVHASRQRQPGPHERQAEAEEHLVAEQLLRAQCRYMPAAIRFLRNSPSRRDPSRSPKVSPIKFAMSPRIELDSIVSVAPADRRRETVGVDLTE